jgi:putative peptidoglycan lipid II flippase
MLGFVLSSLMGLANSILVSNAFGTSAELDAFVAANRLPETLFTLIAGGALASAFLPSFTAFLTRADRAGAWRLASAVGNLVTLVMLALCAAAWLWAPWIVRNLLAPGFESSAQITLTISLLRIMLAAPVIFGLSGLVMATLNAHQHFLSPALAPAFYRIGQILGLLTLVPRMGVHGLAVGTVIGAALHLLVQLPALRRFHPRYQPTLGLRDASVRQVARLMGPRLLGVAVVQLNFWVNTIIASGQPEGSLAAINFAFQVMIMPQAVIAQAMAIAALPTFSEQVARDELAAMRTALGDTLRGVLFLSLPASIGLILLRRPIIAMIFERGAFDAHSTQQVAWALLWFGAGLLGHAVLEIVVRAFYAMQDTRTPVTVGALMMGLNVVLSLTFSAWFERIGWMPHGGLALANSAATAVEALALLLLMRRRLGGLDRSRLLQGLTGIVLAGAVMGVALWMWSTQVSGADWFIAATGVLLGGGIFWGVALLSRVPEARELPRAFLRRRSSQAP